MEMAVRIHAINVQSAAQRVRFSASSVDLSTRLRDEALLIVGPLSRVHRVCVRRFFCSACRSGEFSRMICSIDDQSPPAKLIVLRCRTRRALLSRAAPDSTGCSSIRQRLDLPGTLPWGQPGSTRHL